MIGEGLDILARTGDLPRYVRRDGKRSIEARYRDAFGGADGPATWQRLFLTRAEAAALGVLLMASSGGTVGDRPGWGPAGLPGPGQGRPRDLPDPAGETAPRLRPLPRDAQRYRRRAHATCAAALACSHSVLQLLATVLTQWSIRSTIDRVVNSELKQSAREPRSADLATASAVVRAYVALTVATVAALIVMSAAAPRLAASDAWGHTVIVAIFVILLPLRMRAARRGSTRALRAVTVMAAAVLVVNVVEAALPHAFPGWMRIEMVVIAALMALLVGLLTGRVRR